MKLIVGILEAQHIDWASAERIFLGDYLLRVSYPVGPGACTSSRFTGSALALLTWGRGGGMDHVVVAAAPEDTRGRLF